MNIQVQKFMKKKIKKRKKTSDDKATDGDG